MSYALLMSYIHSEQALTPKFILDLKRIKLIRNFLFNEEKQSLKIIHHHRCQLEIEYQFQLVESGLTRFS